MIQEIHHVPGRLRAKLPQLKVNPRLAGEMTRRLAACPGVLRVDARKLTGSVIVEYQPGAADPEQLLLALGARADDLAAAQQRPAGQDDWADRLAGAAVQMVAETLLTKAIGGPAASLLMALI